MSRYARFAGLCFAQLGEPPWGGRRIHLLKEDESSGRDREAATGWTDPADLLVVICTGPVAVVSGISDTAGDTYDTVGLACLGAVGDHPEDQGGDGPGGRAAGRLARPRQERQ